MGQTGRLGLIPLGLTLVLALVVFSIMGPVIGQVSQEIHLQTGVVASSELATAPEWTPRDSEVVLDIPEADLTAYAENTGKLETVLSADGQVLAINMPGLDWDRAAEHKHSVRKHGTNIVGCVAEIMKWFGGTTLWSSGYYNKIPSWEPKFPAFALVRNLGEGYDALFTAGKLGGCSGMSVQILEKEFGKDMLASLLKLNGGKLFYQFNVVVVTGRKVDRNGNESYFPISLYLVPVAHFDMWRCDWNLEWMLLPTPQHIPCK